MSEGHDQDGEEGLEREMDDVLVQIDAHITNLERLLRRFYTPDGDDDDDGGAGLVHLEALSYVYDALLIGDLRPTWADAPIWSEHERDRWSEFATEISDHVYAIRPLTVRLGEVLQRLGRRPGLGRVVLLKWRIAALADHRPPPPQCANFR